MQLFLFGLPHILLDMQAKKYRDVLDINLRLLNHIGLRSSECAGKSASSDLFCGKQHSMVQTIQKTPKSCQLQPYFNVHPTIWNAMSKKPSVETYRRRKKRL